MTQEEEQGILYNILNSTTLEEYHQNILKAAAGGVQMITDEKKIVDLGLHLGIATISEELKERMESELEEAIRDRLLKSTEEFIPPERKEVVNKLASKLMAIDNMPELDAYLTELAENNDVEIADYMALGNIISYKLHELAVSREEIKHYIKKSESNIKKSESRIETKSSSQQ